MLSQKADGETLFWQGEDVVIQAKDGESHALFICQNHSFPEQAISPLSSDNTETIDVISIQAISDVSAAQLQEMQPTVSSLLFNAPRVIELPKDIIESHKLDARPQCRISESFITGNETIRLNTPDDTFVIDAYSETAPSKLDFGLIIGFLLMLWIGVALSCKSGIFMPKTSLRTHPLHAIAAFLCALICAYFISKYLIVLTSTDRKILPGYGEMLVSLGGNFMAFLGVSAFIFWFWQSQKKLKTPDVEAISEIGNKPNDSKSSEPTQSDAATAEESSDHPELRQDSVSLPLVLGIVLSIIAALSVLFAPLPGITLSELASQLVSTGYLTAYFALLAGICEECLFRGVIQTSLMAKPGARYPRAQNLTAILITTLLFVLLHVPQSMEHLWALYPIAFVSIISGILRVRSGALYQSILLHISYNSILLMPSLIAPLVV